MQREHLSLVEFQRNFSTEKSCMEYLIRLRWPMGYECPRCGHGSYYFHGTRNLYQCSKCKYQVSVTAGTIFDKTRVPLTKWFQAIFLMTIVKPDITLRGLGPILSIRCYKTLWVMGHKIRKAITELSERKEANEFDDALSACLSSKPATFTDLKS